MPTERKQSTKNKLPKDDLDSDVKKRKTMNLETSKIVFPLPTFSASFSDDLFSRADKLAEAYKVSLPYLHSCIDCLMNNELLHEVKREILTELIFTAKETDIYKVNQTGDLKNLDGLKCEELSKLASLFKLRNALYSSEFREFVSKVTGCGPLSGSVQDLSINNYSEGCHLLCHDDVIGTRRVSYILYLVDENWKSEDGGELELYPLASVGTPDVVPTVSIPPKWNQFVMFTVQPGSSFHSVQEVLQKSKPRLSVSGWFHYPLEGECGYIPDVADVNSQASLQQLEEAEEDEDFPFVKYSNLLHEKIDFLSKLDIDYLSKYINPEYLQPESLEKISIRFGDESCIELKNFLIHELSNAIQIGVSQIDKEDGYQTQSKALIHGIGIHEPWRVTGNPVKHRYLSFGTSAKMDEAGIVAKLLKDLQCNLFESQSFRNFLTVICTLCPKSYRGLSRRFRPGLDYTLAATSKIQPVLDATLCFANGSKSIWESQDVGGYECYVAADDGDFDPAVYRGSESEGSLIMASADWNSLILVLRDEDVLRFVKYVSARAPGSRFDVSYEYD
ncbi:hypothetical protein HK096_002789, partial [Nowakowskiella sp. JEL0078]